MAVYKKISKDNLVQFLQELTKDRILIAPVREHDLVSFSPAADAGQVDFTFSELVCAAQKLVFSANRTDLFLPHRKWQVRTVRAFFARRYCAFRRTSMRSQIYSGPGFRFLTVKFDDNYYSDRRKNTIIIGLGCQSVGRGCFCFKVGGGPLESNGADIFLTPAGGDFLAEGVTDLGN